MDTINPKDEYYQHLEEDLISENGIESPYLDRKSREGSRSKIAHVAIAEEEEQFEVDDDTPRTDGTGYDSPDGHDNCSEMHVKPWSPVSADYDTDLEDAGNI